MAEEKKGWISVRYSFYLDGKIPKKEMAQECMEIIEVFMNAQTLWDEGRFLAYGNAKTKTDMVFMAGHRHSQKLPDEKSYLQKIIKMFIPEFKKVKDSWHVVIKPDTLYTTEALYQDLFILWRLDEYFRARYGIGEGTQPSFDIDFDKGKPIVIGKENLMVFEYKVEDNLKHKDDELTEKCIGDIMKKIENIREMKSTTRDVIKKDKERAEKWIKAVDNLVK